MGDAYTTNNQDVSSFGSSHPYDNNFGESPRRSSNHLHGKLPAMSVPDYTSEVNDYDTIGKRDRVSCSCGRVMCIAAILALVVILGTGGTVAALKYTGQLNLNSLPFAHKSAPTPKSDPWEWILDPQKWNGSFIFCNKDEYADVGYNGHISCFVNTTFSNETLLWVKADNSNVKDLFTLTFLNGRIAIDKHTEQNGLFIEEVGRKRGIMRIMLVFNKTKCDDEATYILKGANYNQSRLGEAKTLYTVKDYPSKPEIFEGCGGFIEKRPALIQCKAHTGCANVGVRLRKISQDTNDSPFDEFFEEAIVCKNMHTDKGFGQVCDRNINETEVSYAKMHGNQYLCEYTMPDGQKRTSDVLTIMLLSRNFCKDNCLRAHPYRCDRYVDCGASPALEMICSRKSILYFSEIGCRAGICDFAANVKCPHEAPDSPSLPCVPMEYPTK